SGDVLIANITFRALQDSGTTNVDISQADSMLYSGPGEKSLNSVSGASIALASAPVVQNPQPNNPPPPSSGGSSSSSGGSGGSSSSGSVSNRSRGGGVESGSSNVQGQPAAPGRFESFAAPTPSTELNLPEPG